MQYTKFLEIVKRKTTFEIGMFLDSTQTALLKKPSVESLTLVFTPTYGGQLRSNVDGDLPVSPQLTFKMFKSDSEFNNDGYG